jgi:NADPH-dependent ferric siderophore reductase
MTDRPTDTADEMTEERARAVLASNGHATREIQDLRLTVLAVTAAAGPFIRVRGRLTGVVVHSDWTLPNLAVRVAVPDVDGDEPASRIYTVRSFDPATEQIELDILRHDHDSPMMRWIAAVRPGDTVGIVGPRPHFVPDHEAGRPALMLADDSAVAALYSVFRHWPDGATGVAYVRTADPAVIEELDAPNGVTVHRVDGPLLDAARRAPSGHTLWAAGERAEMRAIRDHFRTVAGLPRGEVRPYGYWQAESDSTAVDKRRLAHFSKLMERGDSFAEVDDLDI